MAIVDEAEKLGDGLFGEDAPRLLSWLHEKGVTMLAGVHYKRITDEGLVVTTKEGETRSLEGDSILTALPLSSRQSMPRRGWPSCGSQRSSGPRRFAQLHSSLELLTEQLAASLAVP